MVAERAAVLVVVGTGMVKRGRGGAAKGSVKTGEEVTAAGAAEPTERQLAARVVARRETCRSRTPNPRRYHCCS